MKDLIIGDDYEKAKKEAKLFYSKIGRAWCPALGEFVHFNEAGFHHLIQKGKKFRPRSEQKRRFRLLVHAKTIVNNSQSLLYDEGRSSGNPRTLYWAFRTQRGSMSIKLIVRQIGNGKKHFLSIYGKDKNPRRKDMDF